MKTPGSPLPGACLLFAAGVVLGFVQLRTPPVTFELYEIVTEARRWIGEGWLPTWGFLRHAKFGFYYRPLADGLLAALFHFSGFDPVPYHVVFSLALGGWGAALWILLGDLGVPRGLAAGASLFSMALTPALWEAWFAAGSELLGAAFLTWTLVWFGRTRRPLDLLRFAPFALATAFTKETERAYLVPLLALHLLATRQGPPPLGPGSSRARGWGVGIAVGAVGLSLLLPLPLQHYPKSPMDLSIVSRGLALLAAQWHPLGVGGMLLVGIAGFSRLFPRPRPLGAALLLTALFLLTRPPLPAATYYESLFPSDGAFLTFALAGGGATLGLLALAGTLPGPARFLALAPTAGLLLVLYATLLSPLARSDPSARNLLSLFPFAIAAAGMGLLRLREDALRWKPSEQSLRAMLLALPAASFAYHAVAAPWGLSSRLRAQARVEWETANWIASRNLSGTVLVCPDNLFPIEPQTLRLLGNESPLADARVSSLYQDPSLYAREIEGLPAPRLVYVSRGRSLLDRFEPEIVGSAQWVLRQWGYQDFLKVQTLLSMESPSPFPIEAYLQGRASTAFRVALPYLQPPRDLEDVLARLRGGLPMNVPHEFVGRVFWEP